MADPQTYVEFNIGQAFPADSVVAQFVARLCVVTNDLTLAQENTGREHARSDGGRDGVSLYYLYVTGSHFREAAKELFTDLELPEVSAFVAELNSDAQARLQRLKESCTPFKESFVGKYLKPLRDQTFHYPSIAAVAEALRTSSSLRSGIHLGSGSYAETRYEFADQILTTLASVAFGTQQQELEQVVQRLGRLVIDYVYFTHAVVTQYLKQLPAGTIDRRDR